MILDNHCEPTRLSVDVLCLEVLCLEDADSEGVLGGVVRQAHLINSNYLQSCLKRLIVLAHQQLAQLLLDRRVQRPPVRGLRCEVNLQKRNHTI